MKPIIKEDILKVLNLAEAALAKQDYLELSRISNHTIHDASIFQEDDPLTLAVLMYALSKVIQRCVERNHACPIVLPQLRSARDALNVDDENGYRSAIKNLLHDIGAYDSQMKLYIQEVVQKARIKKGTKLHEHGISMARTAELLGLSQWELQTYIGQTITEAPPQGLPVSERIKRARELFK